MLSVQTLVVIGAVVLAVVFFALIVVAVCLAFAKRKPSTDPIRDLLENEAREILRDEALAKHVEVVDRMQKRRAAANPQ